MDSSSFPQNTQTGTGMRCACFSKSLGGETIAVIERLLNSTTHAVLAEKEESVFFSPCQQ